MNVQDFVTTNFHVLTDVNIMNEYAEKDIKRLSALISDVEALPDGSIKIVRTDGTIQSYTALQMFPVLAQPMLDNEYFKSGGFNKNYKPVGFITKTAVTVQKAVKVVRTAKDQLRQDIYAAFTKAIADLRKDTEEAIADYRQTIEVATQPDLLESYFTQVKKGADLTISSVTVDTTATNTLLVREKLADKIALVQTAIETGTKSFVDVSVSPDNLQLLVKVDCYEANHKQTFVDRLTAALPNCKLTWQEIPAFDCAFLTITL